MARPKNPAPSYLLHKPTGKARVRLKQGTRYRDVYLGEYGSPESVDKYRQVVAEYLGNDGEDPAEPDPTSEANPGDWTVAELAVHYDDFASSHYVKRGEKTNDRYRAAMGPLVTLFGGTLAKDFGPKKLTRIIQRVSVSGSFEWFAWGGGDFG